MASKHQQMQSLIRLYKEETGAREVDMHAVAMFATRMGWPLPQPADPIARLAKEFAAAAREEVRTDAKTGMPYRANHVYTVVQGGDQINLWVDIDEAPRLPMLKSLVNRREQMVGDGLQLTLDADHWNRINPQEEPIVMDMDFTDDIEWRKNAPPEDDRRAS